MVDWSLCPGGVLHWIRTIIIFINIHHRHAHSNPTNPLPRPAHNRTNNPQPARPVPPNPANPLQLSLPQLHNNLPNPPYLSPNPVQTDSHCQTVQHILAGLLISSGLCLLVIGSRTILVFCALSMFKGYLGVFGWIGFYANPAVDGSWVNF